MSFIALKVFDEFANYIGCFKHTDTRFKKRIRAQIASSETERSICSLSPWIFAILLRLLSNDEKCNYHVHLDSKLCIYDAKQNDIIKFWRTMAIV